MPSLQLDTKLIWFAHCPKAGGTSVEKLMVERWGARVGHLQWGWDRWWQNGGWRVADPPNSPQHLIWEDAQRVLERRPDHVFALVRDPVTRIESEYRWQRRHRRGRWLGKALAHLPFGFWLCLMLAMVRRNPYVFDNHFRAQAAFIPPHAMVFKLEQGLSAPLCWLQEISGTSRFADPPHLLKTGGNTLASPTDRARVTRSFAEDYQRFNYERPDLPLPGYGFADVLARTLTPFLVWLERRGWV